MNEYLNYDKQTIGQISLEEACLNLERMEKNFHALQYAVISFHSALQCYLSIALRGTWGINTWKKQHAKQWLKASENNEELPDVQLDYFLSLFDKLFKNDKRINREKIVFLNNARNEFTHFVTDGYSLHIPSIIEACKEAFEAIRITPEKSKGIFFYDERHKEMFTEICRNIPGLLNNIEKQYNKGNVSYQYP